MPDKQRRAAEQARTEHLKRDVLPAEARRLLALPPGNPFTRDVQALGPQCEQLLRQLSLPEHKTSHAIRQAAHDLAGLIACVRRMRNIQDLAPAAVSKDMARVVKHLRTASAILQRQSVLGDFMLGFATGVAMVDRIDELATQVEQAEQETKTYAPAGVELVADRATIVYMNVTDQRATSSGPGCGPYYRFLKAVFALAGMGHVSVADAGRAAAARLGGEGPSK